MFFPADALSKLRALFLGFICSGSVLLMTACPARSENHIVEISESPYAKANQKLTAVFEEVPGGASPGRAWLVLSQNDKELWRKFLPLKEEVNLAKTDITVNKASVEVLSQYPFSAAFVRQTFKFDGKSIVFSAVERGDASQDEVNTLIDIAGTSSRKELSSWKKEDHEIMYPGHYINGDNVKKVLSAGASAANKLYRAGKAASAAERLAIAFDASLDLIALDSEEIKIGPGPDRWIAAWKLDNIALPASDYISVLNDYGYYLQLAHKDEDAIAVFNAVIKTQPDRAVVYLNLADSLWPNRRREAIEAYKKYVHLLLAKNAQAKPPARVSQRLALEQSVTITPAKGINNEP